MTTQILIVDDELENLNAICDLLKNEPYSLLRTTKPERAMAIALESQPDLIITDWDMPGLSGIDLIEALKKSEHTRDIPVIMCTGKMTSSENLAFALRAGAVDYVRKPVEAIELQARTHSMLKLSAAIRTLQASQKELAWQNEQLQIKKVELYLAATTDHLTGVHNRAYLMEALTREFTNSRRYQTPLSCLIFDIDHFKSFNDRYGHLVGDHILRETAQMIAGQIRNGDILARYGGDEFVAMLPDTTAEKAALLAENVRDAVEQARYNHQGMALSVTTSLGVTDCQIGNAQTEDDILKQADDALYAAKRAGRNRVALFQPPASAVKGMRTVTGPEAP